MIMNLSSLKELEIEKEEGNRYEHLIFLEKGRKSRNGLRMPKREEKEIENLHNKVD